MRTICLYFEIHQIIHLKRYMKQDVVSFCVNLIHMVCLHLPTRIASAKKCFVNVIR